MTAPASSSNFKRSCNSKLFQSWWSCQYRRLRCSADLAARGASPFVLMKFNPWRQRLNFTVPSCTGAGSTPQYMAGHQTSTSLWLSDSYTCEFGFVCQWWLLFSSFQCGYVAFDLFFPFPKSSSASQYANDDWRRPTWTVDLTAREPCRIFTFAKHVSFEHSTGIPCPVISSIREGNINKRTKLKSFLTLDRRSVSPHRPACLRALRGQWAIWLAPRLSLATESTGTVLIPSQMSEIAGHALPGACSTEGSWIKESV